MGVIFFILHIALLVKLKFFMPQLFGATAMIDFDSYFNIVKSMAGGGDPYAVSGMVTLGPPLVLLFFVPFGLLDISSARQAITILNIICGYLSCYFLAKKFFPKTKVSSFFLLASLLFSAFPTRFSISSGQPIMVITFLVTTAFCSPSALVRGLVVALSSSIKTYFLFWMLSFLKKQRKVFLIAVIFFILILGLSFIFIKPIWYENYFTERFTKTVTFNEPAATLDYYNQSIRSTLIRLNLGGYYFIIYMAAFSVCGGILITTGRDELGVIFSVLLSPFSWQHYFAVFFPVFIFVFAGGFKNRFWAFVFCLSLFFWWVEFPWLHKAEASFLAGILASHYFLSGVILSGVSLYGNKKGKNDIELHIS